MIGAKIAAIRNRNVDERFARVADRVHHVTLSDIFNPSTSVIPL